MITEMQLERTLVDLEKIMEALKARGYNPTLEKAIGILLILKQGS